MGMCWMPANLPIPPKKPLSPAVCQLLQLICHLRSFLQDNLNDFKDSATKVHIFLFYFVFLNNTLLLFKHNVFFRLTDCRMCYRCVLMASGYVGIIFLRHGLIKRYRSRVPQAVRAVLGFSYNRMIVNVVLLSRAGSTSRTYISSTWLLMNSMAKYLADFCPVTAG